MRNVGLTTFSLSGFSDSNPCLELLYSIPKDSEACEETKHLLVDFAVCASNDLAREVFWVTRDVAAFTKLCSEQLAGENFKMGAT